MRKRGNALNDDDGATRTSGKRKAIKIVTQKKIRKVRERKLDMCVRVCVRVYIKEVEEITAEANGKQGEEKRKVVPLDIHRRRLSVKGQKSKRKKKKRQ